MPIILDGTTGITTPGITNTGTFVFQGPVQVPAGSAATASITTAAGANTGIFFPSSSSVAITTAGTEKFSVGTGLVINDGGLDFDTRIEGDTDANLVFVDASADRVGVGTNTPGTKFDVAGIIRAVGTGYSAANSPTLYLDNTTASTGRRYALNSANSGIFQIADDTAGGASRIILDSSGNLGLGVTPSAWGSGSQALQNQAGALFTVGTGSLRLFHNTFYDGTNNKYVNTAAAAGYIQDGGAHQWFNAASGTAGTNATFTQAMTLTAAGEFLVGVTSIATGFSTFAQIEASGTTGGVLINSSANQIGRLMFTNGNTSGNEGLIRYDGSNSSMQFWTAATERARITSGGELLVNRTATSSGAILAVTGTNNNLSFACWNNGNSEPNGIEVYYSAAAPNGTANRFLNCLDTGATRASIRSNGGLANYQANNVDLSDARTKKDITPAASMWGKVAALEIVTYKYNDQTHDDVNLGVIAQQVEAVEPVWVDSDGWGDEKEGEEPLKTVYTKDITFAAIKALQEAMARIEVLEADMAVMKGLN